MQDINFCSYGYWVNFPAGNTTNADCSQRETDIKAQLSADRESCNYTPNCIPLPAKNYLGLQWEEMIMKPFTAILCICLSIASCEGTDGRLILFYRFSFLSTLKADMLIVTDSNTIEQTELTEY